MKDKIQLIIFKIVSVMMAIFIITCFWVIYSPSLQNNIDELNFSDWRVVWFFIISSIFVSTIIFGVLHLAFAKEDNE